MAKESSNKPRALLAPLLLWLVLPACSGEVLDDPHSPPDAGEDRAQGSGDEAQKPSFQLEACEQGLVWSADAPCAWEADELCYETKEAACSCVCPPDRDSTCSSGLPGDEYARVPVYCY